VYDDIMQSLAPLVMDQKPDGVIWWVGNGANGKSTLMEAIYRIFPGQLSSLTVKSLTDGRDTPRLNGTLANVVKESSEGRIDDTEIYKAVGTHEDFTIHKFHSQDTMTIRGNLHHIFSGNAVPTFNDKGWSARRRTFIVPFVQRFHSDPNFEARTFTPELFADLVAEMCRYAVRLRDQGLRYKWSAATLAAKAEYDVEANNAEEYAREIIQQGVVGFESFNPLRIDYENWCADQGYVPLGINNLRKAVNSSGFERRSIKSEGGRISKLYLIPTVKPGEFEASGMGRPGMYIVQGFVRPETPPVPDFHEPDDAPEPPVAPVSNSRGKWFE
jgi:phage/plasmid-associated DNA primase